MSYQTEIDVTAGKETIIFEQDFTGNLVLLQAYIIPLTSGMQLTKKEYIGDGVNFYEVNGSEETATDKVIEVKPRILSSPYRITVTPSIDGKVKLVVIVYNAGPIPSMV